MNHTRKNDDPDELGRILWRAAFDGDAGTVKALIDAGGDVNFQSDGGWTPLHNAIENYQVDVVSCLLNNGADIDISDSYGTTPLHLSIDVEVQMAIYELDVNKSLIPAPVILTSLLVEHGANVHARDYQGASPLDWAITIGHVAAEKILRMHGAVESKSSD